MEPNSVIAAVRYFADLKICNDYMRNLKWAAVRCPPFLFSFSIIFPVSEIMVLRSVNYCEREWTIRNTRSPQLDRCFGVRRVLPRDRARNACARDGDILCVLLDADEVEALQHCGLAG